MSFRVIGRCFGGARALWCSTTLLCLIAGCAAPQRTRPAPEPPPPAQPPPPPALPSVPAPSSDQPLVLERVAHVAVQPARARTSGQSTPGSAADIAFMPPDGRYLLAGGNDDRAWIADLRGGGTHWKSPSLGKDVQRVAVCRDRFAVQSYEGRVAVYEWVMEGRPRVIDRGRYELGYGKLRGLFSDCRAVAYSTLDGKLLTFDTLLGQVSKVRRDARYATFESRVDEQGWIFVPGDPWLQLYNLRTEQAHDTQVPLLSGGAKLLQAHVVAGNRIVTEHCDEQLACVVRLLELSGSPQFEHRLSGAGGVWVADVPSGIAVSSDARYFVWYRDGLPLQVIEIATGRRAELPAIARSMSTVVALAFSPYDLARFAVTLTPAANEVSVYEIR